MPNIQSKHWMAVAEIARILSQFFLEIKSQTWILEFINTSKDASERTLFAFVCWTRDVGSKQLFENDKTRLELET